jgi:hypothetical protein
MSIHLGRFVGLSAIGEDPVIHYKIAAHNIKFTCRPSPKSLSVLVLIKNSQACTGSHMNVGQSTLTKLAIC